MSESKDIHYLVVTPFTVISAEDGALLRPGSRCVVETEERRAAGGGSIGMNEEAKK